MSWNDGGYGGAYGFDVQQVCLNGHIITDVAKTSPRDTQKYCSQCGAETITECQKCGTPLRGLDHDSNVIIAYHVPPPAYCLNCGAPYPWTELCFAIASELVAEADRLSEDDKKKLTDTFPDLAVDTPKTQLATMRFNKIVKKAGSELANGLRGILIDIVSESVKKALWGPHA
jgi:hypothetical protein